MTTPLCDVECARVGEHQRTRRIRCLLPHRVHPIYDGCANALALYEAVLVVHHIMYATVQSRNGGLLCSLLEVVEAARGHAAHLMCAVGKRNRTEQAS